MAENVNMTETLPTLQEAVRKFTVFDIHWGFIPYGIYGVCWMIQSWEAAQLESIHFKKGSENLCSTGNLKDQADEGNCSFVHHCSPVQPVVHNFCVGALFLCHFERFAMLEISVVNL